jgi:hypothetical protein
MRFALCLSLLWASAAFAGETDSKVYAGVHAVAPSPIFQSTIDLPNFHRPLQPSQWAGSYYAWGQAQNGWGYCYEWASPDQVLNGGRPVPNYLCEQVDPSHFYWGQGRNGFGYCYQWTSNGLVLNEGTPQANNYCEAVAPSYYGWGQGKNGFTYCYQFTANGFPMNEGNPVNNYFCQ